MKEALALAGGARARRLSSAREEELLGLLAAFRDGDGECGSDRELSFSDLVEAGARPSAHAHADLGAPAPREDRPCVAVAQSSPGRHDSAGAAVASKQQRQQQAAKQRARRSGGSRGSCGGGGDGVLLNFYVPGLLTRSMTTPRPGRGPPSPGAVQGAQVKKTVTAAVTAGKASRTQAALGIGCWPALWGRGRRPAKAFS